MGYNFVTEKEIGELLFFITFVFPLTYECSIYL